MTASFNFKFELNGIKIKLNIVKLYMEYYLLKVTRKKLKRWQNI